MEHHRQCQGTESAKCKQHKKSHPYSFTTTLKTQRFRRDIWGCSGFSCVVFHFVSSHTHSSACTPCCSNDSYCICCVNNYIGLDSQRERHFTLGGFCWRLALELPLMLGAAFCLLWKLLHGSLLHEKDKIFCILMACTLPCSRMEERDPLSAPQTMFCFYPVTV